MTDGLTSRLARRIRQIRSLLVGSQFVNHDLLRRRIEDRYETETELTHFATLAKAGFVENESLITKAFIKRAPSAQSALVIGCGSGREAFALLQFGFKRIKAIDISSQMIQKARSFQLELDSQMAIEFSVADFTRFEGPATDQKTELKFDLVFVSAAIVEHLRGRENRIDFYRKAAAHCTNHGRVVLGPEVRALQLNSAYFLASMILRVRFFLRREKWEAGDTARGFFGAPDIDPSADAEMTFYHFYPSLEDFQSEINEAGLSIEESFDDFVLARPTQTDG